MGGDPNAGGVLTALHSEIQPHPLNPRKDFETADAEEALDELRVSIVKSGLLQPIVVRPQPQPGRWWIIAGERRYRAIGQAISDGDWEDDQPIAITVRDVDDRDHLLLALNENLRRPRLAPIARPRRSLRSRRWPPSKPAGRGPPVARSGNRPGRLGL